MENFNFIDQLNNGQPGKLLNFDQMSKLENIQSNESDDPNNPKPENLELKTNNKLLTFDEFLENDESDINNNNNNSNTSNKKYYAIAKTILDNMDLPEGFEFDENSFEDKPESLVEVLENLSIKKAEKLVDQYIQNNLSEYQKNYTELVENGVSPNEAASLIKQIKDIDSIDPESIEINEDIAEKVLRDYFSSTTKFSKEKIELEIEELRDSGMLNNKASKVFPELKEIKRIEKEEKLKQTREKQLKDQENLKNEAKKLENFIKESKQIGNLKITEKLRNKWKKEFEQIETESGDKTTLINEIIKKSGSQFDALIRLYNSLGLFKWDEEKNTFNPDFSSLGFLGERKALEEIEKSVESENQKRISGSGRNITDVTDSNSEKDYYMKKLIELGKKTI